MPMRKQKEKKPKEQKAVRFPRLVLQSVPELLWVRILTSLLVALLLIGVEKLLSALLGTKITALTSANLKSALLSWQAPVILVVVLAMGLAVIALDLFVQVLISGAILRGEKAGFFSALKQAFLQIRSFLNPAGISLLVYVLFGAPLVGIGFSVEATENFKLPNFIMSVVRNKPLFLFLYIAGCAALVIFGILYLFAIHGVLLSGKTPSEAKKYSIHLLKKNWKKLIVQMGLVLVSVFAIRYAVSMVLQNAIPNALEAQEELLPDNHMDYLFVEDFENGFADMTDDKEAILQYRLGCSTAVLAGSFAESMLSLLLSAFVMLYFTKLYLQFDHAEQSDDRMEWLSRQKNAGFIAKLVCLIAFTAVILLASVFVAVTFDASMHRYQVPLVAHRGGGDLASENSADGVTEAVRHHCYGTETDIQRTKDGYYIINHDDTFKRMAGVNKASQNMTLEEIQALRIPDTRKTGGYVRIPTLEGFLDRGAGRIHYFLELKGATADRQMADDVVRIVKEKGLEDQVTIISLKYDLIDYVESTYPEMDTGVLFFLGTGNLQNMNCDMLIVEEGMATQAMYQLAHDAGKRIVVWTVNTHDALYDFLDDNLDGVITDKVELAEEVAQELEERTELQIIEDRLQDFWN